MGVGGPFAVLDQTEAHYLRMCRMRHMSRGELDRLLSGEPAEAAPWVESAARYGLVTAQLRYGQMLLDGDGVRTDPAAALGWFMRAAERGDAAAMNMVGRCRENGWGVAADLAAAAGWYRRSAEAGCDWGEYNYANMLFDGRGLAQDQAQAVTWYERAAAKGHARAMNLLARCYEEGWGVAPDAARACAGYRRSADAGYFRAQFNFATLLVQQGRPEAAAGWFGKALEGADPDSRRAMADALAGCGDPRFAALGREAVP